MKHYCKVCLKELTGEKHSLIPGTSGEGILVMPCCNTEDTTDTIIPVVEDDAPELQEQVQDLTEWLDILWECEGLPADIVDNVKYSLSGLKSMVDDLNVKLREIKR